MTRRLVLAALLAVPVLVTIPASAWNGLDGNDVWPHTVWPGLPVSWYLHQSGSADLGGLAPTRPIVQASFDSWMNPACTVWETSYAGTTTRMPGPDGVQVVAWIETAWPYDSVAIGIASTYMAGPPSAVRIVEADISFNGDDFTWNTTGTGGGVDTQSIATHEIGHLLGLDHDGCTAGETMCAGYGGGTDPRTLSADDITGVCTIYPAGCTTTADCPPSFECVTGACVAVPGQPCTPCEYHGECGGEDDYCLSGFPDGHTYCAQSCLTDDDCPWRYDCVDLSTGTERQCVPYDMSCDPPPTPECDDDSDCTGDLEVCDDLLCVGTPCSPCASHWDCGDENDYCLSGFPDSQEYCGSACTTDGDCPWGYECEVVLGGESQCLPYTGQCNPAPLPQCSVDGDCPSGFECNDRKCEGLLCTPCVNEWDCGPPDACLTSPVDGNSYCGESCTVDADCPWGFVCTFTGLGKQCFPHDLDCATLPEPECDVDEDCTEPGTRCIDRLCLQCAVDGDCGPGEVCTGGTCIEEGVGLPLCAQCTTHEDCGGPDDLCVSGFTDGTKRCGVACDSVSGECGEGNSCMSLGSMTDQCLPDDMDCTTRCVWDTDCPLPEQCVMGSCTSACDPEDVFSCRAGHYCLFVSCGLGTCAEAAGGPGVLGQGEACTSDLDCASLRCEQMLGASFCSSACDPVSGGCVVPAICQPIDDATCGACSCSAGMLGDVCETDDQCQSGLCAADWPGVCTIACPSRGCPAGFGCAAVGTRDLCVPVLGSMGNECSSDDDCSSGTCVETPSGSYCSRACDEQNCTCPEGWVCRPDEGSVLVCMDASEDTDPDADSDPDAGTVDPVPSTNRACGCTMVM